MTKEKKHNQPEPGSAGQSGSDQGLPRDPTADSESVEELLEEGNSFQAGKTHRRTFCSRYDHVLVRSN